MSTLDPIPPEEILIEEFLKPMGLSQYRLAREIGVAAQRISKIVAGKRVASRPSGGRNSREIKLHANENNSYFH